MTFRKKPMSVLLLEAEFPLVESGGKRLDHLREDFYDNAVAIRNRRDATPIVSPYDIALSGGEPYSVWR
tara:strand:- start:1248 stop:1454 length:207 start_codon:yes stop_codon:yes gene_type:complete